MKVYDRQNAIRDLFDIAYGEAEQIKIEGGISEFEKAIALINGVKNLMIAAPELLECLKECNFLIANDKRLIRSPEIWKVINKVRTAIMAAEC